MNNLRELQQSPESFRQRLLIPSAHGAKVLAEIAADFQTKDFAVLDRSFLAVSQGRKPDPGRIWIERTKGCSKDGDLSAMLLWLSALSKFRMYRRLGMTVKFETGGKELSRKNLGLLIVRARFGGRLVDSNSTSKMTDAQS